MMRLSKISKIFIPAIATSNSMNLQLDDLFDERVNVLSKYCAKESGSI